MLLLQGSPGAPVDGREGDGTGVKRVARIVLKLHRIRGRPFTRCQHLPRLLRHLQQKMLSEGCTSAIMKPTVFFTVKGTLGHSQDRNDGQTLGATLISSRRRQKVAQVAKFLSLKKMDIADRRLSAWCTGCNLHSGHRELLGSWKQSQSNAAN